MPNANPAKPANGNGNGNAKAIEWIKLLLPPFSVAVGGYLAIKVELHEVSTDLEYLRRDFAASESRLDHATAADFIKRADERFRLLEARVRQHAALGVDGVPHPVAWRPAIEDLRRRVGALEE